MDRLTPDTTISRVACRDDVAVAMATAVNRWQIERTDTGDEPDRSHVTGDELLNLLAEIAKALVGTAEYEEIQDSVIIEANEVAILENSKKK